MAEQAQRFEQNRMRVVSAPNIDIKRRESFGSAQGERIQEQEGRLVRMTEGVGMFITDLTSANELAKQKLDKSTAFEHILKGAGVATVGVTGEVLSKLVWKTVEGKIGENTGEGANDLIDKLKKSPIPQKMVENIGIMAGYNWVSSQIDDALPKIPVHYLGLSLGIDLLDKGVLNKGDKDTWLNYSNAVTDTGVGMIVNGVMTFGREFQSLRRVRVREGQEGVEKLLFAKAQAASTDQRKARAERLVRLIEGDDGKKNGAAPKEDSAKT